MLAEICLHRAGNCLSVPLHLIMQVYRVQFTSLQAFLDEPAGLGKDPRLTIEPFFIQPCITTAECYLVSYNHCSQWSLVKATGRDKPKSVH